VKKGSKKAERLAEIAERTRMVADWLTEAASGVECGLPQECELEDIAQEYRHFIRDHHRDIEKRRTSNARSHFPSESEVK